MLYSRHGLALPRPLRRPSGWKTAEAEIRKIAHAVALTALYIARLSSLVAMVPLKKQGMAYASALLDPKTASALKVGDR